MALPEFLGSSWLTQRARELLLSMGQRLGVTLLGIYCLSCGLLCAGRQLWLPDSVLSRVRGKAQTQAQYCINPAHSADSVFLHLIEVLCLPVESLARLFVLFKRKSVWASPELTVWGLQN